MLVQRINPILRFILPLLVFSNGAFGYSLDIQPIPQTGWQIASALTQQTHNVDWNIQSITGTPNVISELQWQQVGMDQVSVTTKYHSQDQWYWQFELSQGQGSSGTMIDSDYNGDNRTRMFSQSMSQVYQSKLSSYSTLLGFTYQTQWHSSMGRLLIGIAPAIGLSRQELDLRFNQGNQTFCDSQGFPYKCSLSLGPFSGLDSQFGNTLQGSMTQLGLSLSWSPRWQIKAEFGRHQGSYQSQMDWNLRQDLQHPVSQSQRTNYQGSSQTYAIEWQVRQQQSLKLYHQTSRFYQAGNGYHTFHFQNNDRTLNLNNIHWQTKSLGLQWQYFF